jgi:poly(beta-D-mannuronate) lyase
MKWCELKGGWRPPGAVWPRPQSKRARTPRSTLNQLHRHCLAVAIASIVATGAHAVTHIVDSVDALQMQINAAAPGDTISLRDGVYTTSGPIRVTAAGAKGRPITITAATVGGVQIRGTHGFEIAKPAAHVVVRGFKLTHASGRNSIGGGTSHVQFTRNTIACEGPGPYLTVTGDDAEVDHNEFRDKKTLGNMINVTGTGSQVARRLHIHHNYFHDFANTRGNGAETIRLGLSGLSMSTGEGLVEYNLFVRCTGENELISNKSCGNTYRYNTFLESPGTQLTLRHGNDCLVYGNIFRGLDGLRIFGDRHLIFSNYFEGNTRGINLGNGGAEVADGAALTSHDRPDHCVIVLNTLVNNRAHYVMDGRNNGLGATHTVFANNLIQGGGAVAKIGGLNSDATWRGNLLWKTGEVGDLPPDGYTTADPLLTPDAGGIYRLSKASPALGAAVGDYSKANVDMDGQPRPAKKSIGADEPGDGPAIARMLTPADVGPAAK